MSDIDRIQNLTSQIIHGFYEQRAYMVNIKGDLEERVEQKWQRSLVEQLVEAVTESTPTPDTNGGTTPAKPESSAPGNQAAFDLVYDLSVFLKKFVGQARIILGYDVPMAQIADTVCGECGGVLIVAEDASSDVICTGTPSADSCGKRYPYWEWLALLNTNQSSPCTCTVDRRCAKCSEEKAREAS